MSKNCQKFQLNNLAEEKNNDGSFDLKSFVFRKGKCAFLFDDFNFEEFVSRMKSFLQDDLKQIVENLSTGDSLIEINFYSKKSLAGKLKLAEKFSLVIYTEKNILKFYILPRSSIEKGEEKKSFGIGSVISNSFDDKIADFIYEYISSEYLNLHPDRKPGLENEIFENIDIERYILISEILGGEKLLGNLNVQSVKKREASGEIQELENGCLITGETGIFLLLQNKNNDLIECSEISKLEKTKKTLLKNIIYTEKYILFPKRSNAKLFSSVADVQDLKGNLRIRKLADINFNRENYFGAKNLYRLLIERENNASDLFFLLLNEYKTGKENFETFVRYNDITKILNDVLALENAEQILISVFEKEKISFEDKTLFLSLFAETADENDKQEILYPIYESHRKAFLKQNKEPVDKAVFDIKYAEFLIKYEKNRKAKKILNDLLKHLPDETVSDLIPPDTLDLTSDSSGPLLKITVLDLLAEVKGKEDAVEEIQKMTFLQPLNEKRIEKLISVKEQNLRNRAEIAYNILKGNGLFAHKNPICKTDYKPLNEDLIKKYLRHPSITKKGKFYNFQKWLSKLSDDDYFSVKKYSEKISAETHNTLFAVLNNTVKVFGLENVEFYISKGERNDEIVGYEGSPPFVIIGYDFVNEMSPNYMNLSELQFTVASETAHIYFKHTKLTSKDVWRGLIEKGSFVADAALAVIPVAGFLSKTLKNVPKLNLLTKLFQSTANGIAGGKSAYDAAIRFSEYYGKKGKMKTENQKNLIAVSRLMQYTADRAGLLLCGNLASAVKAVLLTEKFENNPLEEINETSLKTFLLKQNSDDTYKNQKTALRIANLYAFYFSEDYAFLRKKIDLK